MRDAILRYIRDWGHVACSSFGCGTLLYLFINNCRKWSKLRGGRVSKSICHLYWVIERQDALASRALCPMTGEIDPPSMADNIPLCCKTNTIGVPGLRFHFMMSCGESRDYFAEPGVKFS